MASSTENKKFNDEVLPQWLLDDAIDWIKSNLNPDDVFDQRELEIWAEDNGMVHDE